VTAPPPAAGRRELATAAALVLAALALRLPGHLASGLWFDEIRTLIEIRDAPLAKLLTTFGSDNNHPLYSLLARLAIGVGGESAWTLRLPAVLFGALAVGALYLYGVRVAGRGEALFAAALLASSYHAVWFSQNARGYTMLLFLTLVAQAAFERLLADGGRRARAVYATALALAVYTHLTAAFLAVGHLAATAIAGRDRAARAAPPQRRQALAGVAWGGGLAALLYAPMAKEAVAFFASKAATSRAAAGSASAQSDWLSPLWALEAAVASLGLGAWGFAVAAGAAALLLWGTLDFARRASWRPVAWLAPGAALGLALVALGRSVWPRFFLFLAGFALLALGRGAARLGAACGPRVERALPAAAVALLVTWSALLPRAWALPKQDFEGARDYLERVRRPGDVVVTTGLASMPYRAYYVTDYVRVTTPEELAAVEARAAGVYVVSTLPEFLRSRQPQLAAELAARGREVARFRGGVGDGDVVVLRLAEREP